ncbi:VOC family protein [Streptomyces sp. NPDC053431]|uniref:VOC family protein n=1 Tax=Streptomyces sp. NPDC053431 TaxID=3365703 RepID=UPI0037D60BDA
MTHIDHVTVIVADADATARLLGKLLGAEVQHIADSPALVVRTLDIAGVEIHLVDFRDDIHNESRKVALGLHHVALRVPDLVTAVERFHAAGVRGRGEPVETAPGVWEIFVDAEAAGGVPLQLVERRATAEGAVFDASAVARLAAQASLSSTVE